MNTRTKVAATVAALGLTCAWTAQATDPNCSDDGVYTEPETEPDEPLAKDGDDYKGETTTSGDPEILAPPVRYLDYEVHKGKTKLSFRIKEGGTLKFKNKSTTKTLRIKSDAKFAPFVVQGDPEPRWEFTVNRKSNTDVTIDEKYVDGMCFTYSTQIDGATAEDPIVIIERK